jgi:hypothetical protein
VLEKVEYRDVMVLQLEPENSLKILWERFATAIKSAGPTSIIVVENHSHPALTSSKNNPGFH